MLLASPVSLGPIVSSPVINSVSSLTAPLLTSSAGSLLSSIVNPLLSTPLLGSVLTPLVGPVITSLPQGVPSIPLGPVGSLPSVIPLSFLLALNPSNLFQPRTIPAGTYSPAGISGLGGSQYSPSSPSVVYYSAPSHQPTYSGSGGEMAIPPTLEMDLYSEAGSSGVGDAIVTVGLGNEDEATFSHAGLQEVTLGLEEDFGLSNLAVTLLTGVRPRASLLPQRGSQVAPVATLLSDDAGEMTSETALDENGRLDDLLINPAATYARNFSLRTPSIENKKESSAAANHSTVPPPKGREKSSITDVLMFGFVTAMMAFRCLRSRRTDCKKNQQPELAVQTI
jgi:hypothetical protein